MLCWIVSVRRDIAEDDLPQNEEMCVRLNRVQSTFCTVYLTVNFRGNTASPNTCSHINKTDHNRNNNSLRT